MFPFTASQSPFPFTVTFCIQHGWISGPTLLKIHRFKTEVPTHPPTHPPISKRPCQVFSQCLISVPFSLFHWNLMECVCSTQSFDKMWSVCETGGYKTVELGVEGRGPAQISCVIYVRLSCRTYTQSQHPVVPSAKTHEWHLFSLAFKAQSDWHT